MKIRIGEELKLMCLFAAFASMGWSLIGCKPDSTEAGGYAPALGSAGLQHMDPRRRLAGDHALVQADFIGEVRVAATERPSVSEGKRVVTLDVLQRWYSRWPEAQQLRVGVAHWPEFADLLSEGTRLVVMLSGGPWSSSPFTRNRHSILRVEDDGRVTCESGNPLFAVNVDGFVCSIQEYQYGAPIAASELRDRVLAARAVAARRLPHVESTLSEQVRPLQLEATPLDVVMAAGGGIR